MAATKTGCFKVHSLTLLVPRGLDFLDIFRKSQEALLLIFDHKGAYSGIFQLSVLKWLKGGRATDVGLYHLDFI